ncbi:MAG: type II toxin-antitoxin system prevent-host-death family antitoxin [Myxococcota bacterium]|nr:type II toxin-antitoxin system prevent-host-death family antitoxin [Myxococcota bacterium]
MKIDEIGIFEAKTGLSDLVRKVMKGQRFYITRRGKRVAELRPVPADTKPLRRGCARNETFFMSDDFDEPIDDFEPYR